LSRKDGDDRRRESHRHENPGRFFSVSLIPYTLNHTTLGRKKTGDAVNIETDILFKYLDRLLKKKS